MFAKKISCHICKLKMEAPSGDEALANCPQCGTGMTEPYEETQILSDKAVYNKIEGELGVDIALTLTDKRIIIVDAQKEEVKGGFLSGQGGLIGGALEGALKGAKAAVDGMALDIKETNSIPLDNIASLHVVVVGLFKHLRNFIIRTKDGKKYDLVLGKKIAPQWEDEIRKKIG